jgi:hypothetical protein
MKSFASATRVSALAMFAAFALTGCKKADAPVFSPAPGTYTGTQLVTMTSATYGATIVYTTDGRNPSCEKQRGAIYSAPIAVTKTTTLKAMACALLRAESPITSGTYTIRPPEPVATPAFSPAAGLYLATQSVSITSATDGASIRYTSDGTVPSCTSGTIYSGAIEVAQDTMLSRVRHPSAGGRAGVRPGSGRIHGRAERDADVRDAGGNVQVQHRWPEPGVRRQYAVHGPDRHQQFADAQGRCLRRESFRQPDHQRRI